MGGRAGGLPRQEITGGAVWKGCAVPLVLYCIVQYHNGGVRYNAAAQYGGQLREAGGVCGAESLGFGYRTVTVSQMERCGRKRAEAGAREAGDAGEAGSAGRDESAEQVSQGAAVAGTVRCGTVPTVLYGTGRHATARHGTGGGWRGTALRRPLPRK